MRVRLERERERERVLQELHRYTIHTDLLLYPHLNFLASHRFIVWNFTTYLWAPLCIFVCVQLCIYWIIYNTWIWFPYRLCVTRLVERVKAAYYSQPVMMGVHSSLTNVGLVVVTLLMWACVTVRGHGRLFEPPGRSTAWRLVALWVCSIIFHYKTVVKALQGDNGSASPFGFHYLYNTMQ